MTQPSTRGGQAGRHARRSADTPSHEPPQADELHHYYPTARPRHGRTLCSTSSATSATGRTACRDPPHVQAHRGTGRSAADYPWLSKAATTSTSPLQAWRSHTRPARDGRRRPAFVVVRASRRRLHGPCSARAAGKAARPPPLSQSTVAFVANT